MFTVFTGSYREPLQSVLLGSIKKNKIEGTPILKLAMVKRLKE
jgi:hypothetical protein